MFLIVWTVANVALTILLILAVRRTRKMAEILERAGNLQMDFLRDARAIMKMEAELWACKEKLQQESQPV